MWRDFKGRGDTASYETYRQVFTTENNSQKKGPQSSCMFSEGMATPKPRTTKGSRKRKAVITTKAMKSRETAATNNMVPMAAAPGNDIVNVVQPVSSHEMMEMHHQQQQQHQLLPHQLSISQTSHGSRDMIQMHHGIHIPQTSQREMIQMQTHPHIEHRDMLGMALAASGNRDMVTSISPPSHNRDMVGMSLAGNMIGMHQQHPQHHSREMLGMSLGQPSNTMLSHTGSREMINMPPHSIQLNRDMPAGLIPTSMGSMSNREMFGMIPSMAVNRSMQTMVTMHPAQSTGNRDMVPNMFVG